MPATLARGAEVSGEEITPTGDVDEFNLEGVAGQSVQIRLNLPFGPNIDIGTIVAELVDVAGEVVLGEARTYTPGEVTSPVIDLPAAGPVLLRFRCEDWSGGSTGGAGPYVVELSIAGT